MEKTKRTEKQKKASDGRIFGLRIRPPGGFRLNSGEYLLLAVENIFLTAVIAWVFYDSPKAAVIIVPISAINVCRYVSNMEEELRRRFLTQYREMLSELTGALEAGYSVENAFADVEKSLVKLYGPDSELAAAIHTLNSRVALSTPVEKAFSELAAEYPYEEVESFAGIFSFAKRLGGDYIKNIRKTAGKIEEKVELRQEITAAIAEKQLELKVMLVMPAAIIGYVKLSSPEFLKPMYGNPGGAAVMSGCIAVYAAAMVIGRKIVDIKV